MYIQSLRNVFNKEYIPLKQGYIKLILTLVLSISVISGGIYGSLYFFGDKATTILYRSSIEDKINALHPYIDAADTFNNNSLVHAYQSQLTLAELRNGMQNKTIALPDYKNLKNQLDEAKENSTTPYEDVNKTSDEVLSLLNQLIPLADQLTTYYQERTFEKDNFVGGDNLAKQYMPLAKQFNAAYSAFDLALDNHNNELYMERMKELSEEKRHNAVNFIELNILLAQTIAFIDPDGNTDTQKVESNLQEIDKRLSQLQLGTKSDTQTAVTLYQEAVKEFVAAAHNYITVNSSYGEAYTQLYIKYNHMISRANAVNINDLDAVEAK